MIDGSVLQSAQRCFEKKSRVVVKMVVISIKCRDGSHQLGFFSTGNQSFDEFCSCPSIQRVRQRSESFTFLRQHHQPLLSRRLTVDLYFNW